MKKLNEKSGNNLRNSSITNKSTTFQNPRTTEKAILSGKFTVRQIIQKKTKKKKERNQNPEVETEKKT